MEEQHNNTTATEDKSKVDSPPIKLSVKHQQRQNGGRKKQDLANKVDFEKIAELMSEGLTDRQLGVVCGVCERTVQTWRKDRRFAASLKKGKDISDARVERSLYERATGYNYQAVKIMQYEGQIITQEYTEHCPPDPTSMIFWLKNRKPTDWRDRKEITGANGDPLLSVSLVMPEKYPIGVLQPASEN